MAHYKVLNLIDFLWKICTIMTREFVTEVIEYIRIRFGFESFSSNLEYSGSDSRILETEYYSNIRIFFLESRIFETYFSS